MLETRKVFVMINIFIIIIGIASLMAGLVGVGNIMLITVKERTREIGIRKSIGATRMSILNMIITEAVLITTAAGYFGIILGVALTELASSYFTDTGESNVTFVNPTVDLNTVLVATLFLIVCGVVCGVIPALKATRISPIEAMRAD
ncbi:MAG: FtsX-like permease family protein [Alistipes sp.]|nr:FtsX-like permease family protein [Alistipes sp.]